MRGDARAEGLPFSYFKMFDLSHTEGFRSSSAESGLVRGSPTALNWKEFRDARTGTGRILTLIFAGYLLGLGLIIASGGLEKKPSASLDTHAV